MAIKAKALKEKKVTKVKEIQEILKLSKMMILTEYKGMSVKQLTELRRELRKNKAEYKVFKNTFVIKALPQELGALADSLAGPVAIVFGFDDISAPAKTLVKYIGENEKPVLLCGVIENQICKDSQIKELAKLPSKQELLAKVVGGMKAPLYGLVNVTQGPLRKFVYALSAIKDKKSQGGEQ